ncbi:non-specific lipid transfer protein GPI-anchored 16-like [Rhododendron vialii]|uniref:non-specific lipid transfer protein GPI-anchored 16-like n=1 Tax=Rhododendron vialii TaxID=182163 RepID=UPI00265E2177|nr:non-specific lipid transfer protein GPI-anchored 16-like [Rhododendron vialii]
MEGLKGFRAIVAITAAVLVVTCSVISVQAQISTPCTASQITSFTPCINFLTGSSAGGSATPTAGCCDSVASLMSGSMDCACLIVTGNVPISLPINRTLAISLPRACNLPLQCKASGVPLPAPGPVIFAPPPPPLVPASSPLSPVAALPPPSHVPASSPSHVPASSPLSPVAALPPSSHVPASPPLSPVAAAAAPSPFSPTASKSTLAAAETPAETPASPPVHSVAPTATPGIKPVVTSTSASSPSYIPSPFVLLVFMGIMAFKGH